MNISVGKKRLHEVRVCLPPKHSTQQNSKYRWLLPASALNCVCPFPPSPPPRPSFLENHELISCYHPLCIFTPFSIVIYIFYIHHSSKNHQSDHNISIMCNGFQFRRECLKIKAFYLHFSSHHSPAVKTENPSSVFNDFLTLRFLPRMIHDPLEIDGSLIQSAGRGGGVGGPAFLTLYKLLSSDHSVPAVPASATHTYGSRDDVKASEGVRFEIYNGDAKVLKGTIRKDEQGSWKLDCKRGEFDIIDGDLYGKEAYLEVAIDVDGQTEFLNDTVKMMRRRRIMNTRIYPLTRKPAISGLEEIPEDLEFESDGSSTSSSCCCCECDSTCGTKHREEDEIEMELENESSWAVDAAILVVSLGVGYLISRASTKKLVSPWR